MLPYIREFLGALIMILICDGVVANTTLNRSGMKGAGSIQITIAIGLSLLIPCCLFGNEFGTYFNSALTLALAIDGTLAWMPAIYCIAAQFAGVFVGCIVMYIMFKDQFDSTEDPGSKLGVFSTCCSIPNLPRNVFCEAVGTFVFVLAVKGIGVNAAPDMQHLLVSLSMVGIGMSMGGLTGYALNPARDLAARIAHAVLPIKGKGCSNWRYSLVPVVGPIIGAILAVLLFGKVAG